MRHLPDVAPAEVEPRTAEELRMHQALQANAPRYAGAFLEQLPRARTVVLHRLLAALWREDIGEIRTSNRRVEAGEHSVLATLLGNFRPGTWSVRQFGGEIGATATLAF